MSQRIDKNNRGDDINRGYLVESGETTNNTQGNSRIATAATPDDVEMLVTNLHLSFQAAAQTEAADKAIPAGFYQFFSGRYSADAAHVSDNPKFSAATQPRPFPKGTTQLPLSENMKAVRSRPGEELFLIVQFYDAVSGDVNIGVEANCTQ